VDSLEKHNEQVSTLFLKFGLSPNEALRTRYSDLGTVFKSKAFEDWKKAQEASYKQELATINRLDALLKVMGNLGNAIVAMLRRSPG
jgi:hypothetical protein